MNDLILNKKKFKKTPYYICKNIKILQIYKQ